MPTSVAAPAPQRRQILDELDFLDKPLAPSYPFGAELARARREKGFPNPHSFYKASGGARLLKLSYPNYLALERGRSLPKPERLQAVLRCLDLAPGSARRVDLLRSYLASVLGSQALLQELEDARPEPVSSALSLSEETARMAVRQKAVHRSLEQWRVLACDRAAGHLDTYLSNTPGFVGVREAAAALGLSMSEARRALRALAAAKLVEVSGDRARSRHAYKLIKDLPVTPATSGVISRVVKSRQVLLERSRLRHDLWATGRFYARNFDRYLERVQDLLDLGSVYGGAERAADSRVFAVQTRVFELFR